jgi:hypothetical protein
MDFNSDILFNIVFVIVVSTLTFFIIYFKNNPASRNKMLDYDYISKLIIYLLPFLAIVGVITPLILGMYNFAILGIYLAVPMLIGPLIFYVYFYRQIEEEAIIPGDV